MRFLLSVFLLLNFWTSFSQDSNVHFIILGNDVIRTIDRIDSISANSSNNYFYLCNGLEPFTANDTAEFRSVKGVIYSYVVRPPNWSNEVLRLSEFTDSANIMNTDNKVSFHFYFVYLIFV